LPRQPVDLALLVAQEHAAVVWSAELLAEALVEVVALESCPQEQRLARASQSVREREQVPVRAPVQVQVQVSGERHREHSSPTTPGHPELPGLRPQIHILQTTPRRHLEYRHQPRQRGSEQISPVLPTAAKRAL
jgi:hypothetical protein